MIKKLQALKAKKGFTLVELVVVIAIIGVLAAILVPTMMGVVQDSNITSANSAASTMRTQVTSFLTKADTAGKGVRGTGNEGEALTKVECVVADGEWTCTADSSLTFGGDSANTDGWEWQGTDTNKSFSAFMGDMVRDFKNGAVVVYLQEGACVGLGYVNGGVVADITGVIGDQTSWPANVSWAGQKAGVADDSVVVGTAPVVGHSASST